MLDRVLAGKLVKLALAGIDREYPYKMGTVLSGADDLKSPRQVHAVFNGHFDWHSSVHGHWTLVRLLRLFPDEAWAESVRNILEERLSESGLLQEADFLRANPAFERMYGWAWVLKLGSELRLLGGEWMDRFAPLEDVVVENAMNYLPKLDWPVRCGFHPESSFAMSQMLDWARLVGDVDLEALVINRAEEFYGDDENYPVQYEPSGNDFFSAGLNVADLMRRVYDADGFNDWFSKYLPRLGADGLERWSDPVGVSDLDDGQIVHLVGLNLSRAWCLKGIASVHACEDQKQVLLDAAERHMDAGLKGVWSGSYEGEHWLGSFALYTTSI